MTDLKCKIDNVDDRKDSVVSCETFGDLVIAQCGRYIKYSKIINKGFEELHLEDDFKDANIAFDKNNHRFHRCYKTQNVISIKTIQLN